MSDGKVNVKKGLEGVVVDTTSIAKVIPEINSLVYRCYPVQDLCDMCRFEEVAFLMWNGELPKQAELDEFEKKERSYRTLSKEIKDVILAHSKDAHPMDVLRTAVSFYGAQDERTWEDTNEVNQDKAIRLLAQIPSIIAADIRRRKGQDLIEPKADLTMSENFFHMAFGEVPDADIVKSFDVSLILYAEHSFNASTFTTRVIKSTMSDLYSAVVGGIGALKGPLHGGANEQVMYMLKEVGEEEKARDWMLTALKEKRKIMGFGHRVYKKGDSRVPTMKKYALKMADKTGAAKWMKISQILEDTMVEEKNIYPNLDFPAGPAYYMMGFEIDMFTPIFVMSRITGWSAHIIEQTENNRIIRPLSEYTGHGERKVTSIGDR